MSITSARRARLLEDEDLTSQASPRSQTAPEAVCLNLQQFLDEWHYRIMRTSIGKQWNRQKVVRAAMEVLSLNGLEIEEDEMEKVCQMDDRQMGLWIVGMMPIDMLDTFEHFSMELQLILQMVTQMRAYLEASQVPQLCELLEGGESSGGAGIGHQMLKETLVAAAREVADVRSLQETWLRNTELRVERLADAQESAETCEAESVQVEARLRFCKHFGKDSSLKMLMSMASVKKASLLHGILTAWSAAAILYRKERAYRKQMESELGDLERQLLELRSSSLKTVKSSMIRSVEEDGKRFLAFVVAEWSKWSDAGRKHRAAEAEKRGLEGQLKTAKAAMAGSASRMLLKMSGDHDSALYAVVFQAFSQHVRIAKQEREFEEQVQKQQAAMKDYLSKKKEAATSVLDKMKTLSERGSLQQVLSGWYSSSVLDRRYRQMEDRIVSGEGQLKRCRARQKAAGNAVQGRVNEQDDWNMVMRCLCMWHQETKVSHIDRYYTNRLESRRRQLTGICTLFRSFNKQLEEGLVGVEGDSSGRAASKPRRSGSKGAWAPSPAPSGDSARGPAPAPVPPLPDLKSMGSGRMPSARPV